MKYSTPLALIAALTALLAGCGGGGGAGGGEGGPSPPQGNEGPRITSLSSDATALWPGGNTSVTVEATDDDGDALSYAWKASRGSIQGSGATVTFAAPASEGSAIIEVTVTDANGGRAVRQIAVEFGGTTVEGTVLSVSTGDPIGGVPVTIGGSTGTTETDGSFSVHISSPGQYQVQLGGGWEVAGLGLQVTLSDPLTTTTLSEPVLAVQAGGYPPPPPF
ncbi:MAG: Ig-like domain-containing protein [Armatimonadota bacterium]